MLLGNQSKVPFDSAEAVLMVFELVVVLRRSIAECAAKLVEHALGKHPWNDERAFAIERVAEFHSHAR